MSIEKIKNYAYTVTAAMGIIGMIITIISTAALARAQIESLDRSVSHLQMTTHEIDRRLFSTERDVVDLQRLSDDYKGDRAAIHELIAEFRELRVDLRNLREELNRKN